MDLVRTHPDAEHVQLVAVHDDPVSTAAVVDSKQVERAIYNLLLNACQAARGSGARPTVTAVITTSRRALNVTVTDQGPGVSDTIRDSLFEPFVSVGKQNGAGLGLTLAQCVAEEHGGAVRLVSSRPGETVFVLSIDRGAFGTFSSVNIDPRLASSESGRRGVPL
jgi:nitrogen-specific signal transduction histidine kinase